MILRDSGEIRVSVGISVKRVLDPLQFKEVPNTPYQTGKPLGGTLGYGSVGRWSLSNGFHSWPYNVSPPCTYTCAKAFYTCK
ncbi:hypothetical protein C5167_015754 [Papaver somniferum]|uniref:Uncharacterized protein n=1 Tax=Papaver somniferum TaxID=3469 RepID=A0A4Y7JAD1_PAPSO|nr:hypothetical protein C5167_015754 [Papaver somniferum]